MATELVKNASGTNEYEQFLNSIRLQRKKYVGIFETNKSD